MTSAKNDSNSRIASHNGRQNIEPRVSALAEENPCVRTIQTVPPATRNQVNRNANRTKAKRVHEHQKSRTKDRLGYRKSFSGPENRTPPAEWLDTLKRVQIGSPSERQKHVQMFEAASGLRGHGATDFGTETTSQPDRTLQQVTSFKDKSASQRNPPFSKQAISFPKIGTHH